MRVLEFITTFIIAYIISVACGFYVTHVPAWATVITILSLVAYAYQNPQGI